MKLSVRPNNFNNSSLVDLCLVSHITRFCAFFIIRGVDRPYTPNEVDVR